MAPIRNENSSQNERALLADEAAEKTVPVLSERESDDSGQTRVTISKAQVAEELGLPKARFESETNLLVQFVEGRRPARAICDDENGSHEKLCRLFARLENVPLTSTSSIRKGHQRVPIRPHHFPTQQSMDYSRLVSSLGREPVERVLAWVPTLLRTTSCPRNLSAAALRRLESGLPSTPVKDAMERLYAHSVACLTPSDDGYEITHFRQALLRRLWGDDKGAQRAIHRALVAEASAEKSRVIYWAGVMQPKPANRDKLWNRLVQDYPLSYHALEVWKHRGVDPLDIFRQRPALNLSRGVVAEDETANEAVRWIEALYLEGRIDTAQKLTRWVTRSFKDELSPSNLLYLSALKSNRGTPLNSITFLTRQISENPAILNQQTLQMLFPKPYFDLFARHSPNTDTYLILSVARQESGFNPMARSRANARGLLQLLPSTARLLSGRRQNNLYDTELNAKLGIKYLSGLIDKTGSVELALAAYNAGPGRIPEWKSRFQTDETMLFLDLIPFKETRNYVPAILRNNYWYARLYPTPNRAIASELKIQRSQLVDKLVAAHTQKQ